MIQTCLEMHFYWEKMQYIFSCLAFLRKDILFCRFIIDLLHTVRNINSSLADCHSEENILKRITLFGNYLFL